MKKYIKKLVLKYLQKEVGKEFADIDNRVYDIEVKLGIKKTEHDVGSKYVGNMAVKDAEYLKNEPEPKMTHPELPAEWSVEVTAENSETLTNWKREISDGWFDTDASEYDFIYKTGEGVRYHDGSLHKKYGIIIPFSDFERFVLKKEPIGNTEQKEEIDWSVPGQFVNIAYGNYSSIIVTSGKYDEISFSGLCIKSTIEKQIGKFDETWIKTHTTLLIKND